MKVFFFLLMFPVFRSTAINPLIGTWEVTRLIVDSIIEYDRNDLELTKKRLSEKSIRTNKSISKYFGDSSKTLTDKQATDLAVNMGSGVFIFDTKGVFIFSYNKTTKAGTYTYNNINKTLFLSDSANRESIDSFLVESSQNMLELKVLGKRLSGKLTLHRKQ